jgi:UDP-N-acetylmuramoyl-tripeptide--D-alanyl-D-alanine ligase
MEGTVEHGDPQALWRGAVLDSRKVAGEELFFALSGSRRNGHDFVVPALELGAAGAVVEHPVEGVPRGSVIRVGDARAGLHDLTRAVRAEVPERLVAVTGSVGKTTAKEMLAAMMARRFRVAKNPGNLNNLLGFPVALLGIPDDTEWMVAEMGMSTPGELGGVSRLGRPDVAVFLNVRPVHLEGLGTLEAVAAAKAELLEGLADDGLVVANADDPWVRWIATRHAGRVVWFGRQPGASVTASAVGALPAPRTGSRFRLEAGGSSQEVVLPLHGEYNVDNCLAAAACAWALGVPLPELAAAVGELAPPPGRGVVRRLTGGAVVVDDSYNSNPEALARALESAARLPGERRWAVLGTMLELGEEAPRYHREGGAAAARLGFSPVVAVGDGSRELAVAAAAEGAESTWFPTAAEAGEWAARELRAGDVVLVKGSRGVALEQVVAVLVAKGGGS